MTILADASALVAMMTHEPDGGELADHLDGHNDRLYCGPGAWETVCAVARKRKVTIGEATGSLNQFVVDFGFRIAPIGEVEWRLAVEAHARYGKGTGHPARLNMGDCFAYACAKVNDAVLLYKGNDFAQTDLA